MKWTETRLVESKCPFCDHSLDAAGGEDSSKPRPNDLSVCISCASLLVFNDDLSLRAATNAEIALLPKEVADKIGKYQSAVRALDRRKNNETL